MIKAGKLSAVVSGPEAACKTVTPLMEVIAPQGVSYVGDGELARICKIAHNVMLGVVIENLIEITLLANKMGIPRHAFLSFINNSVMGSMFTRYKSPALVNLDWTTTFTPELLRKDLDLGLELGREYDVPMPVTAATREVLQTHFGAATFKKNPDEYLQKDFAALMETMALAAGMKLTSENKNVPTGLGVITVMRGRALSRSSLPGLTRQSIDLRKNFLAMDARVKPAHDELGSGDTTEVAVRRREPTCSLRKRTSCSRRWGPERPMGEYLRRYWQPIGGASELDGNPIKAIRLLGEDLVLYKDQGGRFGLHRPALSASPRRPVLRLRRGDRHPLQLSRLADGRSRPLHRAAL